MNARDGLILAAIVMTLYAQGNWQVLYADRTEAIREGCVPTEAPIVGRSGRRAG